MQSVLQWGHRLSAMETRSSWTWTTWAASLQWGHRLSAMETRRARSWSTGWHPASMGPPPFGDGNMQRHAPARVGIGASMGPPPFGDGNRGVPAGGALRGTASMGPPPFGDGNLGAVVASMRESELQWGHRLSAMETCSSCLWAYRRRGFNGATAFRRWKRSRITRPGT